MGAQLSTVAPTATVPVDAYVAELGDLMYAADLGRGARFLKTVRGLHRDGQVVIKVFIKPAATVVDLTAARRTAAKYSQDLKLVPNAIGYKRIVETDRAGYLVRQYIKHSLYDRISTRPFLELGEKKWLIYQLLRCLQDCHQRNIFHGDLKSENILVNSWKWIYIVDWAPYKPVRLPETDTAPFLFYFNTSQRRACYVAPERFTDEVIADPNDSLTAQMDIYSAGCVIAELFLDGSPLFTLADLVTYKRGEKDVDLSTIDDPMVRELITSMVSLDPKDRLQASDYLKKYKGTIFPEYFDKLYDLLEPVSGGGGTVQDSDGMVDLLWKHFGEIMAILDIPAPKQHPMVVNSPHGISVLPVVLEIPSVGRWVPSSRDAPDRTGALLILSLVCSTLRSTATLSCRLQCAELVLALAELVGDEARLDRCLPYLMGLVRDEYFEARGLGTACVTHLCTMVKELTPLNTKIFSEYIFPRLNNHACVAAPPRVKALFAACLPQLALTAMTVEKDSPALLVHIDEATRHLLTDNNSSVRRSLLHHAAPLCAVLGKQRTNDIVLSHAITYLNDKDVQVRVDLFEFVSKVAPLIGPAALEQYIVPLMIQSLSDSREDVVAAVLKSLAELAELGLLRPPLLLGTLVPTVAKFCIHPNPYIRAQVVLFLCGSAKHLTMAQSYCLLRPHVIPFLETDISDYTNQNSLIEALRPPITVAVYNLARTWASQARKSSFWSAAGMVRHASSTSFSPEDKQWLERLRDVGFNNEDLGQLLAFRDYLATIGPPTMPNGTIQETQKPKGVTAMIFKGDGNCPPHLQRYIEAQGVLSPPPEGSSGGSAPPSLTTSSAPSRSRSVPPQLSASSSMFASSISGLLINGQSCGRPIASSGQTASSQSKGHPPLTLVASIKAHRGTISALAIGHNQQTFVTAADDGLVKVWDARALGKGASRPVLSYDLGERATAASFLGESSIIVIGSADGTLHFLDIVCAPNENGALVYEAITNVGMHSTSKSPVVALESPPSSSSDYLWLLRSDCSIEKMKLATFEIVVSFINPLEHGPPTCWTFDPSGEEWVAVGTMHGMIDLWDLRFGICVQAWGVGDLQPLTAMSLHPKSSGKWICVAGGFARSLVSVWNVQRVECREVLVPLPESFEEVDESVSVKSLEPRVSTAELSQRFADWHLDDTFSRERPPVTALCTAFLDNSRQVAVTGGGDRILRYWDLVAPNHCGVISGLTYNKPRLTYTGRIGSNVKFTYERQNPSTKKPERLARTVVISKEEADIGRNHRGTIMRVGVLQGPRQMVISVDEVGVVKVFV